MSRVVAGGTYRTWHEASMVYKIVYSCSVTLKTFLLPLVFKNDVMAAMLASIRDHKAILEMEAT